MAKELRRRQGMPVDLTRKILDCAYELQRQLFESGEVASELLITAGNSRPKTRDRFSQGLCVDLLKVRANLEAFINLIGFQLPDRNPANQMGKRILAEAKEDV